MYLTAQRVVSPAGRQGINVFHYEHGGYVWEGAPPQGFLPPERDPGILINQSVVVAPPGNRVRSFIDIVAPAGSPSASLQKAFDDFVRRAAPVQLPTTQVVGCVWFRFGSERVLAPIWRQEARRLFVQAVALLD